MAAIPKRFVLEGVPRVSFYEGGAACPEDIPFPSVMRVRRSCTTLFERNLL